MQVAETHIHIMDLDNNGPLRVHPITSAEKRFTRRESVRKAIDCCQRLDESLPDMSFVYNLTTKAKRDVKKKLKQDISPPRTTWIRTASTRKISRSSTKIQSLSESIELHLKELRETQEAVIGMDAISALPSFHPTILEPNPDKTRRASAPANVLASMRKPKRSLSNQTPQSSGTGRYPPTTRRHTSHGAIPNRIYVPSPRNHKQRRRRSRAQQPAVDSMETQSERLFGTKSSDGRLSASAHNHTRRHTTTPQPDLPDPMAHVTESEDGASVSSSLIQ